MKKSLPLIIGIVILVLATGIFLISKKPTTQSQGVPDDVPLDLPINILALAERPFITLSPDATGRSLDIAVSGAPKEGSMEYEMIYNASGKQEGALGSIFLGSEKQPITKSILLGSKSGGGKVTYHEGVTGGSLTVTYGKTRLKESWNYLHFDPTNPIIGSTDARFSVIFPKNALKKDTVIVTMKTFGYPALEGKVISGPYGYFPQTPVKVPVSISLKLPSGEHLNPTIFEWNGSAWKKLMTKLAGDTVSAPSTGSIFLVTAE